MLKIISRSTFDLKSVLQTLVESAAQLCDADQATITRQQDGMFFRAEAYGYSQEFIDYVRTISIEPERGSAIGRVLLQGRMVHIPDVEVDPEYTFTEAQRLGGFRAVLAVPMLRAGVTIGAMALTRSEPRPFTDKQIELVSTFADQAAIAIENARLLNELRQRTDDLTEALEQQTATSDVLQIISSSPGELEPVFRTILENATRICGANFGIFSLRDGDAFRNAAVYNMPEAYMEFRRGTPLTIGPKHPLARLAETKEVVHVADLKGEDGYREGDPSYHAMVDLAGARTLLLVPTLKEKELIGVITIFRQEARLFTDKQIALVQNFAAQAVIAIENARLLNELRQRTDDLGRSVNELRALGEVSQAVNSTLDLENVLSTIVAKAVQLSGTEAGAIYVFNQLQHEFHLARHLRHGSGVDHRPDRAAHQARRADCRSGPGAARTDPSGRFAGRRAVSCQRGHFARRLSRTIGGAAAGRRRPGRDARGPPPHTGCISAEYRRPDEDLCGTICVGDPERAAIP